MSSVFHNKKKFYESDVFLQKLLIFVFPNLTLWTGWHDDWIQKSAL